MLVWSANPAVNRESGKETQGSSKGIGEGIPTEQYNIGMNIGMIVHVYIIYVCPTQVIEPLPPLLLLQHPSGLGLSSLPP